MLRLIGNILWFILGGFLMGIAWTIVGVAAFVSIIGIPWSRACFMIAGFSFWPFGREAVNRQMLQGREDIGTGPFGIVGNIVWLLVAGWWLALGHLVSAFLDFVTIIGIPFGVQHVKLAGASLFPIGLTVVDRNRPRDT